MDKYEKLLKDLVEKTNGDKIQWEIISAEKYQRFLFNSQYIYQIYEADYILKQQKYTAVLSRRKYPDDDEFGYNDGYSVDIMILKNNKIIFTLTQNHVDRDDLLDLASTVEEINTDTEEFFTKLDD